jgi:hypothetical protein
VDFKAAARKDLRKVGRPLRYTDIAELALESGYLKSAGRTPQNTRVTWLSVGVRDNLDARFVQTAPGVYRLKSTFEPLADAVY